MKKAIEVMKVNVKRLMLVLLPALVVAALLVVPVIAQTAPTAPAGMSAMPQDGKIELAWQPSGGATGYTVYRGTSAGAVTTPVGTSSGATFTDTTATNGTTYFYAVRANSGSGDSPASTPVQATALARSCASGSALRVENCTPGTSTWKLTGAGTAYSGGIEGFATATSVDAGSSIGLKVNTVAGKPYHVEVYRMGWYGGAHGRLVETIPGLTGVDQDPCQDGSGNTGLVDCSNWQTTSTITTTESWVSGVYWARLVRDDGSGDNAVLFVVRNDGSHSDVLYQVPFNTYAAYNNYGGKSLYDFNSGSTNTVANAPRAVKVSFDRPFSQTYTQDPNWFGQQDVASVGFLERNGYDMTYVTSADVQAAGAQVADHKAFISPTHDEYWSAEMRNAVTSARDAGTGLFWMGSNQVYWKTRSEPSPFSGVADRVVVTYKTSQGGPADPVSPTGTWRDPAGANQPENALVGQQYIGDNDITSFPLTVTQAQGKTRIWRHTEFESLTVPSATIGSKLVGWEWNDRVNNGLEPAGTTSFSSSNVNGALVQNSGASYTNGSAVANGTYYRAASGAWVVSTGTNNWSRGLDLDGLGTGEPNIDIQQATVNILADMGSTPSTPMSGVVADPVGAPSVTDQTPLAGATGVSVNSTVRATFDRDMDPATLTTGTFTLTPAGGSPVTATVGYDGATDVATLTPSSPLLGNVVYTVRLKGGASGVASWGGSLAGDVTWTFTTGAGTPPTVSSTTPAANATGVSQSASVTATFDRALDATTVTATSFTLKAGATSVGAAVSYNSATRTATLTPNSGLSASTTYTATLTTAIKGADGTPLANTVTWTFTTGAALTITNRAPAPLATGVSPQAVVRVGFSRAVDAATLTAANVSLKNPLGVAVPATITYDAATATATLAPTSALGLSTTYTAAVTTGVKAADGSPLSAGSSWTFTTALVAPAAPSVTASTPPAGATGVAVGTTVTATFSRAMDPGSITNSTFTLKNASGATIAANVTYSGATATLTPTALLNGATTYTATLTTAVRASDGTPLSSTVSWSFRTADCPCSLMSTLSPSLTGLAVQDGRSGAGPFTYELGTKFTVDTAMNLSSIRYWRDPGETGTHVGRIWNASGTQVASVTFANETASGWQTQALASPIALTAGATYTVSVGFNSRFTMTTGGLAAQLNSGPLHSVVGGNGVFAATAGTYPTSSYQNSNYFVDATVVAPTGGTVPTVTSRSPADGASGVAASATVSATFSVALDAATVSDSSFTLTTAGGSSVPASVAYESATRTARLTPSSPLAAGTSYTARLTTAIKAADGTPLAAASQWSFTTLANAAPSVVSISPGNASTLVTPDTKVAATFSEAMDAGTLTPSTFTLSSGGAPVTGTVAYDAPSRTATLTPSSALAPSTTYTATVTTGARSSATSTPLASAVSWTFTTSPCPCNLMGTTTPTAMGNPVQDGRGGAGPFSYELGTKVSVTQPASLTAVRFYKDAAETGTHTGTVWSAAGTALATVTFTGETASGWQQAALASPVALTPGSTYVVSVGFNASFALTPNSLGGGLSSGPLRSVVDGQNGVYGLSAGVFPTSSWNNSNYFVDAVVR